MIEKVKRNSNGRCVTSSLAAGSSKDHFGSGAVSELDLQGLTACNIRLPDSKARLGVAVNLAIRCFGGEGSNVDREAIPMRRRRIVWWR